MRERSVSISASPEASHMSARSPNARSGAASSCSRSWAATFAIRTRTAGCVARCARVSAARASVWRSPRERASRSIEAYTTPACGWRSTAVRYAESARAASP